MLNFANKRSPRPEVTTNATTFKGAMLCPVNIVHMQQGEGGVVRQNVVIETAPIAGRLLSEMTATVQSVFVPILALDHAINEDDNLRGNAELMRNRYASGQIVFTMTEENIVSKKMGVVPKMINGVPSVNQIIHLGHNMAVNYLRRRVHHKTEQISPFARKLTPALLSSTVLDRLNAVLDPDERINGAVDFTGEIPVRGIGIFDQGAQALDNQFSRQTDDLDTRQDGWAVLQNHTHNGDDGTTRLFIEQDPENPLLPRIVASMDHAENELSLKDFYQAQQMDSFTRQLEKMVRDHPEHGEAMISRVVHGLEIEWGKEPVMVYERQVALSKTMQTAMDGPSQEADVTFSHLGTVLNYSVPVPASEFGGVLVTFVSVKPDENLANRPHPTLTQPVFGRNFMADELKIDPEPVLARDLYSELLPEDEETVVCWVGPNHLQKSYVNYGFSRDTNMNEVANISSIWQYELPLSVTPESAIYPEDFPQTPFSDRWSDAVHCTINTRVNRTTPIIFGPTPVERLESLDNALFDTDPDEPTQVAGTNV